MMRFGLRSLAAGGSRQLRFASGKVGFIGLGEMGSRMAPHLARLNQLHVCDASPGAVQAIVVSDKAVACASPAEVAAECDTVITMLPSGPVLEKVYADPSTGVFAGIRPGTLLIDASTIGPVYANSIAAKIAALNKSIRFCDAPVSGGIVAAEAGTLTFMVGGSEADFAAAKEFLDLMGGNVVHCGGVSAGQSVKVVNNLVLGASMVAVAEAMLVGTKLGCDPKVLAGCLNTATARCWSSDTYNPFPGAIEGNIPSSREYSGGFACDLMLKDLGLALEASKEAGVEVQAGAMATEAFRTMSKDGMGRLDFSGVLKHIEGKKQ